jgi:ribonuclease HI
LAIGHFILPTLFTTKRRSLMMSHVFLHTDGSCLGNPGPGGYAAILQMGQHEKVLTGSAAHTTNNRMELQAVITGLAALKRRCRVTVVTDSQYVATILTGGKAKANQDLVQQVRTLVAGHDVIVFVVAGHSGHALNERCDSLAVAAARRSQQEGQPCAR